MTIPAISPSDRPCGPLVGPVLIFGLVFVSAVLGLISAVPGLALLGSGLALVVSLFVMGALVLVSARLLLVVVALSLVLTVLTLGVLGASEVAAFALAPKNAELKKSTREKMLT